jgi:predicted RNA binding protein YcfA (HicA-like mRNA interferase family)
MRLPRDLSATELIKTLQVYGYEVTRRKASHVRITTHQQGEHHITIPDHDSLKIGTLSGILRAVADHFGITKDDVARRLFDNA